MDELEQARARLAISHKFFAGVAMATPFEQDKKIDTAGTDGWKIVYNVDFLKSLGSRELVVSVLIHELLHKINKHSLRRGERDHGLFNVACDHRINNDMKKFGLPIGAGWLCDKRFADETLSPERIYDILQEEMPPGGGGCGQGGGGEMAGDVLDPGLMSPEAKRELERKIDDTISRAVNIARMAGSLPADLERYVTSIIAPALPWKQLLRDLMTRVTHGGTTWTRRNRRFRSVYLPARKREKATGEVIVIGDTSGSITAQELARLGNEIGAIAKDVNPERIRVIWCDARVGGEQTFEADDPIVCKPQGGGGTDMRVALRHAERYPNAEVVILVTDGFTPWPEREPPFPLIVVCSTNTKVPVGQVVRLN